MQERQVTVGRVRHKLPTPFFVLATQNPIEQEGTYPLPEAQQDRFMFKVFVQYPSFNEEFEIARRTTALIRGRADAGADRRPDPGAADAGPQGAGDRPRHQVHAGPGAADADQRAGRAEVHQGLAELGRRPAGRAEPDPRRQGPAPCCTAARTCQHEDIQALALPVLRHRILTNFTAASEGVTTDTVIKKLVEETPTRDGDLERDERFKKIFTS